MYAQQLLFMEASPSPLSSREPVTFSIFSCFSCIPSPRQSRHPERSASQIDRKQRLYGAESKDPGDVCWQMLLGAFRPQTTTEDKKITTSERSRPVPACRGGICSSADPSWKCFRQSAPQWRACPGVPWDPRFLFGSLTPSEGNPGRESWVGFKSMIQPRRDQPLFVLSSNWRWQRFKSQKQSWSGPASTVRTECSRKPHARTCLCKPWKSSDPRRHGGTNSYGATTCS